MSYVFFLFSVLFCFVVLTLIKGVRIVHFLNIAHDLLFFSSEHMPMVFCQKTVMHSSNSPSFSVLCFMDRFCSGPLLFAISQKTSLLIKDLERKELCAVPHKKTVKLKLRREIVIFEFCTRAKWDYLRFTQVTDTQKLLRTASRI